MADQGFKRKLAAILNADVARYSQLMGENDKAFELLEKAIESRLPNHHWMAKTPFFEQL